MAVRDLLRALALLVVLSAVWWLLLSATRYTRVGDGNNLTGSDKP